MSTNSRYSANKACNPVENHSTIEKRNNGKSMESVVQTCAQNGTHVNMVCSRCQCSMDLGTNNAEQSSNSIEASPVEWFPHGLHIDKARGCVINIYNNQSSTKHKAINSDENRKCTIKRKVKKFRKWFSNHIYYRNSQNSSRTEVVQIKDEPSQNTMSIATSCSNIDTGHNREERKSPMNTHDRKENEDSFENQRDMISLTRQSYTKTISHGTGGTKCAKKIRNKYPLTNVTKSQISTSGNAVESNESHQTFLKTQDKTLSELRNNDQPTLRQGTTKQFNQYSYQTTKVKGEQRSFSIDTELEFDGNFEAKDLGRHGENTVIKCFDLGLHTDSEHEELACLKLSDQKYKLDETDTKNFASVIKMRSASLTTEQVPSSGYPLDTTANPERSTLFQFPSSSGDSETSLDLKYSEADQFSRESHEEKQQQKCYNSNERSGYENCTEHGEMFRDKTHSLPATEKLEISKLESLTARVKPASDKELHGSIVEEPSDNCKLKTLDVDRSQPNATLYTRKTPEEKYIDKSNEKYTTTPGNMTDVQAQQFHHEGEDSCWEKYKLLNKSTKEAENDHVSSGKDITNTDYHHRRNRRNSEPISYTEPNDSETLKIRGRGRRRSKSESTGSGICSFDTFTYGAVYERRNVDSCVERHNQQQQSPEHTLKSSTFCKRWAGKRYIENAELTESIAHGLPDTANVGIHHSLQRESLSVRVDPEHGNDFNDEMGNNGHCHITASEKGSNNATLGKDNTDIANHGRRKRSISDPVSYAESNDSQKSNKPSKLLNIRSGGVRRRNKSESADSGICSYEDGVLQEVKFQLEDQLNAVNSENQNKDTRGTEKRIYRNSHLKEYEEEYEENGREQFTDTDNENSLSSACRKRHAKDEKVGTATTSLDDMQKTTIEIPQEKPCTKKRAPQKPSKNLKRSLTENKLFGDNLQGPTRKRVTLDGDDKVYFSLPNVATYDAIYNTDISSNTAKATAQYNLSHMNKNLKREFVEILHCRAVQTFSDFQKEGRNATRYSDNAKSNNLRLSSFAFSPSLDYINENDTREQDKGQISESVPQTRTLKKRKKTRKKRNAPATENLSSLSDESIDQISFPDFSFSPTNDTRDQRIKCRKRSLAKSKMKSDWSWEKRNELSWRCFDSGIGTSTDMKSSAELMVRSHSGFYLFKSGTCKLVRKRVSIKMQPHLKKNKTRSRKLRNQLRRFFDKRGRQLAETIAREIHVMPMTYRYAYGLASFFNNFNSSRPPTERERMQYEWIRLASFQNYTGNGNTLALARSGFYHDHSAGSTSTRCYLCNARYSNWEMFHDITAEHVRQSPHCPFVTNNGLNAQNIAISEETAEDQERNTEPNVLSATSDTQAHVDVTANTSEAKGTRTAERVNRLEQAYRSEGGSITQQPIEDPESRDRSLLALSQASAHREVVRSRHSVNTILAPRRNNVAAGARSNTGIDTPGNSVPSSNASSHPPNARPENVLNNEVGAGALAGLSISNQTPQTEVLIVSEVLQGSNVASGGPTPSSQGTGEAAAGLETEGRTDPSTAVVYHPKHPDYLNVNKRIDSYHGWPDNLDQTPRHMAEAGFFYVGVADFTRCFCCGGGLRNWEPGDDPMLEHTRWFPRCEYVVRLKGERFVAAVQRRHQEHMAEQQRQQIELAERRDETRNPQDPLETEAAAVMREMGYSEERTREAVLAVRQQTGSSVVTSHLVLTWLLDDEDRQTALGIRAPTSAASSATSTFTVGEIQNSVPSASSSRSGNQQVGVVNGSGSASTSTSGHSGGSATGMQQNDTENTPDLERIDDDTTSTASSSKRKKKKSAKKKPKAKADTECEAGGETGDVKDVKSLKAENEKLREMQTCKICMEQPVNTTLLPCGHLVCCEGCASRLRRCPICRKLIEGIIKTYMS